MQPQESTETLKMAPPVLGPRPARAPASPGCVSLWPATSLWASACCSASAKAPGLASPQEAFQLAELPPSREFAAQRWLLQEERGPSAGVHVESRLWAPAWAWGPCPPERPALWERRLHEACSSGCDARPCRPQAGRTRGDTRRDTRRRTSRQNGPQSLFTYLVLYCCMSAFARMQTNRTQSWLRAQRSGGGHSWAEAERPWPPAPGRSRRSRHRAAVGPCLALDWPGSCLLSLPPVFSDLSWPGLNNWLVPPPPRILSS